MEQPSISNWECRDRGRMTMEAFVLIAFGILSIVGTMFFGLVLLFGLFYETSRMNQKA